MFLSWEAISQFSIVLTTSIDYLGAVSITGDTTSFPPSASTADEDEAQFEDEAWVEAPVMADYGFNIQYAEKINPRPPFHDL